MCDKSAECCTKLEAEAVCNNEQLLSFDVRSKDIKWHEYVTPLQQRAPAFYLQRQYGLINSYREPIGDHNRRQVLVCHDMMGNYLEDRHFHSSRKFDDYRFYHWSGIDYFCYFSHKYITIPPCGWLNAAHKHGVRVLGTFITEGSEGSRLLHEVLKSTEMVNDVVAALVKLCKHYSFEGWLVNVECKVKSDAMRNLLYFLDRLRVTINSTVDNGVVFWYDSILDTGDLMWQNEVNNKNVRFMRSSNSMLINYGWNENSLKNTRNIFEIEKALNERAFFGIDVFGRGQVAKFQSKQTLARIVKYRFSTGIFAPGWTFETLKNFGYDINKPVGGDDVNEAFLQRNDKFWYALWEHIATHPYSVIPFYTDFCLGSGKRTYEKGVPLSTTMDEYEGRFFNLSRQSLQPSVPLYEIAIRDYNDAFNGGSCLRILQYDKSFRLFASNFHIPRCGLVFAYAYKLQPRDGEFDCILRFCTVNNSRDCYLFCGSYFDTVSLQKGRCYTSPFKPLFNYLLQGALESKQIPKEMALNSNGANNWLVRYYVVTFDGPIYIKDIGVLYRRSEEAIDTAYLGAVYLNEYDANLMNYPVESNVAHIPVYGGDLLN